MNSFLTRVRTFNENWKFSENRKLHPFVLAGHGWRCISNVKGLIQCAEDVNKTLVACDGKTKVQDLTKKLALKGCTFSFKPCHIDLYRQVINYYHTTISYKNLVKNNDVIEPNNKFVNFLKKRYDQFDLILLSLRTRTKYMHILKKYFKNFHDKVTPNLPKYYGLTDKKLKSNLRRLYHLIVGLDNITNIHDFNDRYYMISFVLILILNGWSIKTTNKQQKPILFCFLTGNKVDFQDCISGEVDFDPIKSHYEWSPWKEPDQPLAFFRQIEAEFGNGQIGNSNDSLNESLDTSTCSTIQSASVTSHINNKSVAKFMKSMSHINRMKRKVTYLESLKNNGEENDDNSACSLDLSMSGSIAQGIDDNDLESKRQKLEEKVDKLTFLCNESLGVKTYSLNESCEF